MSTTIAADRERRYLWRGYTAHLFPSSVGGSIGPFATALCGRLPMLGADWLGTGSQLEYETAASLPLCKRCVASAVQPQPGTCPNRDQHTACPDSYTAWHSWAEEMAKTHKQKRCGGCGLLAIWVPKEPSA